MRSRPEELRDRTKQFALRIVKVFRSLPRTEEAWILGRQVLRSGTSVAANYRAVCRARSKAEFISKVGTVVEEAAETVFWLELLVEASIVPLERMEGCWSKPTSCLQSSRLPNARHDSGGLFNDSMIQWPDDSIQVRS